MVDIGDPPPEFATMIERARNGEAEAMYLIGIAYAGGRLVPENIVEAAAWFLRAARLDHSPAKTSMAYLYASGQGVARDRVAAYVLLREAIHEGEASAKPLMATLKQRLDDDEIARAERKYRTRQKLRALDRVDVTIPTAGDAVEIIDD